jgi:hypothetical protein
MTTEKHTCTAENAAKVWDWLQTRGGVAVWRSVNLSNPGASWTAPYKDDQGVVKGKPTWEADEKPERIITDPSEIVVLVPKEVKRFHVAVRRGDGLSLKLTDASSRKVRAAVAKAGEGAWYVFDYMFQDAVIYVADKEQPIAEFIAAQAAAAPAAGA